jgi:DNA-binding response OmpR family regulator
VDAQKKVLICEDDPVQLRTLTIVMEQAGYHSLPTRSPKEALTTARMCKLDAVLTDVQLPDGSGFDLVDGLRKMGMDVPVIMATAYATPEMKAQALRAGVQHFFEKPLDLKKVQQRVDLIVQDGFLAKSDLLVVEGRNTVRAEIEEAARQAGLTAIVAQDGTKALEFLKASPLGFDLMLMDMKGSGLSGSALIREALRVRSDLSIVMMTDDAGRNEIRAGYDAGAMALVQRPIPEKLLVRFLKQSLSAVRKKRIEANRSRVVSQPWTRKLSRGIWRIRPLGAAVAVTAIFLLGMILAYSFSRG